MCTEIQNVKYMLVHETEQSFKSYNENDGFDVISILSTITLLGFVGLLVFLMIIQGG